MSERRQNLLRILDRELIEGKMTSLSWYKISFSKHLTDDVIREFADKLDWDALLLHYPFSNELTREFQKYIDWEHYFILINADFSIIKQFILKTEFDSTKQFKTSHLTEYQIVEIQKIFDFKYLFKR
jgi:hypothetical protein